MTVGHWYTNGRLLMDASQGAPFKWNGSTTTYALYAIPINGADYAPDPRDTYLGVAGTGPGGAIPTAGEPTSTICSLTRQPVTMAPIVTASKSNPTSYFVIYPATGTPPTWVVNTGQTMTANWVLFYWDKNVANGLVSPSTAYYPNGTNNAHDTTCPLMGYAPLVDSVSGLSYWTAPAAVACQYDASFTGYSSILNSQVQ